MTWTWDGHGRGAVPKYKFVFNKPDSEFLAGEVEHSHYRGCLGSCLVLENSMMKSSIWMSTLHSPNIIHVVSVPRPSPFFTALLHPSIVLNANQNHKNREDLKTKLPHSPKIESTHKVGCACMYYLTLQYIHMNDIITCTSKTTQVECVCSMYSNISPGKCMLGVWRPHETAECMVAEFSSSKCSAWKTS